MGETKVKIKVSGLNNNLSREIELIVDTGATYTTIPSHILESLEVERKDRVNLELADGRVIPRDMGNVFLEVEGKLRPNTVIFGEEGDRLILGLVTLESCGLTVDPINRKLVPLDKIHHYRTTLNGRNR